MQEKLDNIKSPDCYDWSEFYQRMKLAGYESLVGWCREHDYLGIAYKTVWALINGAYVGGSGPKIKVIIAQALKEKLIEEIQKAA